MKRISCLLLMVCLVLSTPMETQAKLTKQGGVNYHNGIKETYYNLPMDRIYERADRNFGNHHKKWIRSDGCKMYGPFIIAAGQVEDYGKIIESSLGECIILDTGAFAKTNKKQIDIAVDW